MNILKDTYIELLVGLLVEALLYLSLLVQPSKLTIFIDILHEEE